MLDIWTVPLIIVIAIISLISIVSARKTRKASEGLLNERDSDVAEAIEEHPFTLNPIIWVILIAAFFTGIVIFYYATSFY